MSFKTISVCSHSGIAMLRIDLHSEEGSRIRARLNIEHTDEPGSAVFDEEFFLDQFLSVLVDVLRRTDPVKTSISESTLTGSSGREWCVSYRDDYRGIVFHPVGTQPKDLDDMTWDNPFSIDLVSVGITHQLQ